MFTADHNCLSFKQPFNSFLNIPTTLITHLYSCCHDLKQYRIVFKAIFSIRFSVVALFIFIFKDAINDCSLIRFFIGFANLVII